MTLLPRVRQDLYHAAQHQSRRGVPRLRLLRRHVQSVAWLSASAAVSLVVVVALLAAGHPASTGHPAGLASDTNAPSSSAPSASTNARARAISTAPSARRGVSPALRHDFAVFRRAHTSAASALPARVAGWMSGGQSLLAQRFASYGIDPSAAQYVPVGVGDIQGVWLVPGLNGICMVTSSALPGGGSGYGGGCHPTAVATQGQLMGTAISASGNDLVVGVAPDGNATATVTMNNGSVQTVPVHGNVYAVQAPGIKSVTVTSAVGRPTTDEVG